MQERSGKKVETLGMGVCGNMGNALDQKTRTRLEAGRSLAVFFL